jgi:hypothetical protein
MWSVEIEDEASYEQRNQRLISFGVPAVRRCIRFDGAPH